MDKGEGIEGKRDTVIGRDRSTYRWIRGRVSKDRSIKGRDRRKEAEKEGIELEVQGERIKSRG